MSGMITKYVLPLAMGIAALASSGCRKELMTDIKPVEKTPIVTAPVDNDPVIKTDTLYWTVYSTSINADKLHITTGPMGDDNEYGSHHDDKRDPFMAMQGTPAPDGEFELKIQFKKNTKPNNDAKINADDVFYAFWQSDIHFPQSPYERNSYNVSMTYSRVDKKPLFTWTDKQNKKHEAYALKMMSAVSTDITISKNYSADAPALSKAIQNNEDITIRTHLLPKAGMISKAQHLAVTVDGKNYALKD